MEEQQPARSSTKGRANAPIPSVIAKFERASAADKTSVTPHRSRQRRWLIDDCKGLSDPTVGD